MRHISRAALLLTGLALLLAASPAAAQSDTPGDLTDSLVACWDMDEASGVRYDSWGDHHMTDNNTVGAVAGVVGNAAMFVEANGESLSTPDQPEFTAAEMSIVAWFRGVDTVNDYSGDIIAKWGGSPTTREWELYYHGQASPPDISFWVSPDGSALTSIKLFVPALDDVWHMAVAVIGSSGNMLAVDDGAWEASAYVAPVDGDHMVRIGAGSRGIVDQTAIWQRAITNDERLWLYNDGAGRSCEEIIATAPQPVSAAVIPLDENTNYIIDYTFSFGEIATVIALSLVLLAIVLPKILEVVDRWFP